MNNLVTLKDVSVTFPSQEQSILKNINIQINQGDRLLLVGRSGIGKSTLLYLLAGIIPEMIYAGIEGNILRNNFNTAIVMQNPPSQMVTPTVEQEIAFALENRGLPGKVIREKVDTALKSTGISSLRNKKPFQLSGGEMQKVSLTAAIASEPDLLLLDEPTSFLDGESADNLINLLNFLPAKIAVVVIEHKTELFLNFIHEILFINNSGNLIHYGNSYQNIVSEIKTDHRIDQDIPLYMHKQNYHKEIQTNSPLLKIDNLSFSYSKRGKKVLKNISLDMHEGETIAIMGRNGSGKTTLLENIAGFYKQTKQSILFKGIRLNKYSKKVLYSSLSYLTQNPEYFFLYQTVREEINSIRKDAARDLIKCKTGKNIPGKQNNKMAEDFIDKLDQSPFSLSEGEKRRLTLNLALYENRKILLIDEPTYGLDSIFYHKIIKIFLSLKNANLLMLIVTHDPELAFTVADRVLFLNNGSLVFDGTPKQYINFIISNKNHLSAKWYLPKTVFDTLYSTEVEEI